MLPPASRYETPGMVGYEIIPENSGTRQFIWEHLNDIHSVMHQLGHRCLCAPAPKLFIATPPVTAPCLQSRDYMSPRCWKHLNPCEISARVVIRIIRDVVKP
jgi:hypothetical protein